ncbi:Transposase MuDR plant [Arabidopsis thaliana x Arabidopsis arenosa]|uniref:Transposase MuDR plant n=1 Tax=Arabidopsis thaliana x Arabidopsis arenosa TaxID=1240361 RepID=A0A8T1XHE0_9BRAS|nr:Transposase MuDR plant [Arabidopsis thaliana x Arabidopsis arenosa]
MSFDIDDGVNDKSSEEEDASHNVENETVFNYDFEFDEENLVDCKVTGFGDEEEENDDDYRETPVSSDIEAEHYERRSGELKLKQVFDTLEEFKEAMVDYVLNGGWNVKFTRWGKEKSELKCAMKGGCPWRIYCSFEEPVGKWMIKVYHDEHRCVKNGYSKLLTQAVIARLFLNDLRSNPNFKPKVIQEQIQQRWNLIASRDQCRKAKAVALEIIQKEHDEQFSRVQDYQLEITDSSPDSSVEFHEERSKNPKRKRGVQESPVKVTKVTREGRIVRCGRCGVIGHNTRKCGNVGVEYIRPKNRNTTDEGFEFMALDYNEEPSQST